MYLALTLALRDRLMEKRLETEARYQKVDTKRLYYLSMEFLIGRSMGINLYNLGIFDSCRTAMMEMGVDLEEIREEETDAALGNGGLGRLAACFLDSLATLDYPGFGYGITGFPRQDLFKLNVQTNPASFRFTAISSMARICPEIIIPCGWTGGLSSGFLTIFQLSDMAPKLLII